MEAKRYRTWAGSVLAPRRRLLPGIGSRLGRHPRLASGVLVGLRRLPGRRLRPAVYRNLSRPLVERMDTTLVVPVATGARMRVDTSDLVGRLLASSGLWEPHVGSTFSRLLAVGDACVDVGAHIGYYTLLASRLVGPSGRVYALEPNHSTYEELRSNIALNRALNVVALECAAGAADGYVHLVDPPLGNTGEASVRPSSGPDDVASVEGVVPLRAVASVVEPSDRARLGLVKIDAEGFESEVLRGLEPLLESGARFAVVLELHPGPSEAAALVERHVTTYSLTPYELVRGPSTDRFAPVPPPRPVESFAALVSGAQRRTVNVVLVPREFPRVDQAWGSR